MSRLFFISFNLCGHPYIVYPLGMGVVANAARNSGHEVMMYDCLVDGHNDERLLQTALAFKPDHICISVRNLDDEIDHEYPVDNAGKFSIMGNLVTEMKNATAAGVIIGGAAVSLMPEILLEYLHADFAVVGEGERVLVWLLSELAAGSTPERIIYGNDLPVAEEMLTGAYYDPYLVKHYYDKSGFINIQTKRGCVFDCAYCTYPKIDGKKFRYRPIAGIIDDIQRLKTDYNCHNFFFTDSVFNDPAGQFRQLAEAMISENLNIKWTAYLSPYHLTKEDVLLLKQAGLYAVELGTDASNDKALAGMNKKFSWDDVVRVNDHIIDASLPCAHFVIFGGPDETYQTLTQGIANCKDLKSSIVFGFLGVRLYQGTPAHSRAVKEGFISEADILFEPKYYISPGMDFDIASEMIKLGWAGNARLMYPPGDVRILSKSVQEAYGAKGLVWDVLFNNSRKNRLARGEKERRNLKTE